jgi:hypothetical protein
VTYLEEHLAEMACRFGVLFSIMLLIFSSVGLDVFQVWALRGLDPAFYSLVTFAMAIVLVFLYLIFMAFMVQFHTRQFYNNALDPD